MRFPLDMSLQAKSNECAEPVLARARRAMRSVAGALRTHYPRFVFGLPLRSDFLPIFIYHDVEPAQFAAHLEFLRRNRYRTLSLGEFMATQVRKSPPGGRDVLITFDDARRSFYDNALPVLRDFGARATLFVPTQWMSKRKSDDGNTDASAERFMTWDQVRASANSGLVDVESHAHRHALVLTSGRVLDFANPRTLARYDIYDWPMRNTSAGDALGRPPLGAPIYAAAPLLCAERRFVEDPNVTLACTELVDRSGGAAFFRRPDWNSVLRRVHALRCQGSCGRLLPHPEFRELVASEFELSRDLFIQHLGRAPRYLAYPWMMGSPLSLELARSFGIEGVFGVALDFGRARDPRLPVRAFGRLKADWLPLLPGDGRASFLSIAAGKLCGIAKTQHLAH
jgi:peptidoglycan/xylan/chitin deacetylase (PgdA/CDA1 family)